MNGEKIQGLPIAGTEILEQPENPFFVVSTLFCHDGTEACRKWTALEKRLDFPPLGISSLQIHAYG